jgi:hypothetical protein
VTTPTGPGITTPITTPSFLGAVRQQNPVGQNLSANPNVFAPAGFGGDKWGANGGDQVAAGGEVTDQTGYVKPMAITPSSCEAATNYLEPSPGTALRPAPDSRLGRMNKGALPGQTADPLGPAVGNNAG